MKYLKTAGFVILLLSLYLLLSLLPSLFFGLYLAVRSGLHAVSADPMLLMEGIEDYLLHIDIIGNSLVLLACLFFVRYFVPRVPREKSRAACFGFTRIPNPLLIQSLLLGVSCYFIVSGGIFFTGLAELFSEHQQMLKSLFEQHILLVFLGIGVTAVFAEEIVFRGIIFKRLNKDLPLAAALFLQAVFFGMMHFNLLQGGYAFLFGLILGAAYFLTGSLWVPVIAHFGFNVSSIIMVKVFGFEQTPVNMGFLMAAGLVAFAAASAFLVENHKKTTPAGGNRARAVFKRAIMVLFIGTAAVLLSVKAIQLAWSPSPEALAGNYKTRGIYFKVRGEHDRAVSAFSKAIELDTGSALAYFWRGYVYWEKGESGLAIADYSKAIELGYEDAVLYNNRGYVYAEKGEFDLALSDFTRAIELNPGVANPYRHRGHIYEQAGEKEKAFLEYEKAIGLNPEYAPSYRGRGNIHSRRGEPEKALLDYERFLELDPGGEHAKSVMEKIEKLKAEIGLLENVSTENRE